VAYELQTRVTEILGSKYPLVMGTMGYQSTAEFVAAAANAGIFACLSSVMSKTTQALREEIRKTKSLTDKPFGININLFPMISPLPHEEYIDAALEEGVTVFETSGRSPENLVPRIKNGNAVFMHKCARLRDARTAERVGADIVEIVGFECGGHPSRENITSLVLIPQVVDAVKVPVIAGGGIADARGFVAALALGAEGVLMGTRFLATKECPIPLSLKKRLIEAQSTETMFVMRTLSDPMRALRNKLTTEVEELEDKGALPEQIIPMLAGQRTLKAMEAGDAENALLACGQIVGLVHDIPTVKELAESIMSEATAVYEKLGKTLGKKRLLRNCSR
jgi:NAD(P)H-dependent flavin oxidoreductase YrpB (nitropropane dioxygenase family)